MDIVCKKLIEHIWSLLADIDIPLDVEDPPLLFAASIKVSPLPPPIAHFAASFFYMHVFIG